MAQKKSNVKVLNNEYYRQQTTSNDKKQQEYLVEKKHRRHMHILVAFALIVTLICSVQIVKNYTQARKINTQTRTAQKELTGQKSQNADLKLQVKQLKDPEYLQKYIRERYFYSKKHETIFNLPEDRSKSVTNDN